MSSGLLNSTELIAVGRRGPLLRPSPQVAGVVGVDLTAGCGHGCVYCPVRGAEPADGAPLRLPFDPFTAEAVRAALRDPQSDVRTVVLSPLSDPLPPFRQVRAEAVRVAEAVLEAGRDLLVLTRGRIPRRLIELMAAHPDQARLALGMSSLNKRLVRVLEPRAASPMGRIRDLGKLVKAGVAVEVRLEPIIPGLTDTRDNLVPLFRRIRDAGVSQLVVHYLFLHPSVATTLQDALARLDRREWLASAFEAGPQISVGSLGTVRNLPREVRQEGLARVMAWGAEFGLKVGTGVAQNPDLPQNEANRPRPRGGTTTISPPRVGAGR